MQLRRTRSTVVSRLTRCALALALALAAGPLACARPLPTGPGLPTTVALVEVRLEPARDLAALTMRQDTLRLRGVTRLVGRLQPGGSADFLLLAPSEADDAGGRRLALERGLELRLPRGDGATLRVLRADTRPGMRFTAVMAGLFLLGFGYFVLSFCCEAT